MRPGEFVILMYHGIESAEHAPPDSSPGSLRYVVREAEFRDQLAVLRAAGLHGADLSTVTSDRSVPSRIALTFDDGCATDQAVAAPLLGAAGFGATFFIVPGFLGRAGYLSRAGVRELSDLGFEIGSHSMQHDFLTALAPDALHQDLSRSKLTLEDLTGRPVDTLSCPGGRWNRRVAEAARSVGYAAVATSQVGVNPATADRFRLARLAIHRGMSREVFRHRCQGQRLAGERLRGTVLGSLRAALGDRLYSRLHRRLAG